MPSGIYRRSEESNRKRSLSLKGRKITWGDKLSISGKGKHSKPLWKISVKELYDYTCQKCYKKDTRGMVAHHILNFSSFKELRTSIDNGICLCQNCHIKFHMKYGKYKNNKEQLNEFLK